MLLYVAVKKLEKNNNYVLIVYKILYNHHI